jgi:transcriptional regulator with XRE-family HTH domain
MAKRPEPMHVEKIRTLRADLQVNQDGLAQRLGVTQAAVSNWESGIEKNAPSSEAYMLMGNIAPYPSCLWFWERGGLDSEAMRSVAEKIQIKNRARPAPGEFMRIPQSRDASRGIEEAGEPIILSGKLIANPLSTVWLPVNKAMAGEYFTEGDIIILDKSERGESLEPLLGQVVLCEGTPPKEKLGSLAGGFPHGLFIGQLTYNKVDRDGFQFLARVGDVGVGYYSHPIPPGTIDGMGNFKKGERQRFINEAKESAPSSIRPFTGCRIVGRVLGWFKPEGKGK